MNALLRLSVRGDTARAIQNHSLEVKQAFQEEMIGHEFSEITLVVIEAVIMTTGAVLEIGTMSARSYSADTERRAKAAWKRIVGILDEDTLVGPDIQIFSTIATKF
jgi:hypothetical protein